MKLYQGSNVDIADIDLGKCRPNKDFGRGFYLTDIKRQALNMAVRRCDLEGAGTPIVLVYEFDESVLNAGELKVKRFNGVSNEWAEFILTNRRASGKHVHNYDIVIGPVADDGVVFQLNLYQQHLISIEQLV